MPTAPICNRRNDLCRELVVECSVLIRTWLGTDEALNCMRENGLPDHVVRRILSGRHRSTDLLLMSRKNIQAQRQGGVGWGGVEPWNEQG